MFLKAITYPVKFPENKRTEKEWAEFSFRTRLMPNGYRVSLSVIVLPKEMKYVVGASACSPEDGDLFSRSDAANRSLGRARQQAFHYLQDQSMIQTLLGKEYIFPLETLEITAAGIEKMIEPLFDVAAQHAEMEGALVLCHRLNSIYKWRNVYIQVVTV